MPRVNKSQFAVLGCLTIYPMSVYEMKQFIARSVTHFWSEGEGQLYPTLRMLLEKKLVACSHGKAKKGGVKKVYSITQQGDKIFKEWLQKKAAIPVYRNELLLKLFFGSSQSARKNMKLLEDDLMECHAVLEVIKQIKNSFDEKAIDKKRKVYLNIVLQNGLLMIKAQIKWAQDSLKQLQNL